MDATIWQNVRIQKVRAFYERDKMTRSEYDDHAIKSFLGSYTCTCEPGYHGDGRTCIKIDYCEGNQCGAHGHCISLGKISKIFRQNFSNLF